VDPNLFAWAKTPGKVDMQAAIIATFISTQLIRIRISQAQ
jgi:hypothetical protein